MVAQYQSTAPVIRTLKKPLVGKASAQPHSASASPRVKQEKIKSEQSRHKGEKVKKEKAKLTSPTPGSSTSSRSSKRSRTTINSLTVHQPDNEEVPPVPSREPSPPRNIVSSKREGHNAYTQEDRDFLVDMIVWMIQQKQDVTKSQVLKRITELVSFQLVIQRS